MLPVFGRSVTRDSTGAGERTLVLDGMPARPGEVAGTPPLAERANRTPIPADPSPVPAAPVRR